MLRKILPALLTLSLNTAEAYTKNKAAMPTTQSTDWEISLSLIAAIVLFSFPICMKDRQKPKVNVLPKIEPDQPKHKPKPKPVNHKRRIPYGGDPGIPINEVKEQFRYPPTKTSSHGNFWQRERKKIAAEGIFYTAAAHRPK